MGKVPEGLDQLSTPDQPSNQMGNELEFVSRRVQMVHANFRTSLKAAMWVLVQVGMTFSDYNLAMEPPFM